MKPTHRGPVLEPTWPDAVCHYVSNNVPSVGDGSGWEHHFSSAFQMGCEALVKLGYASETEWGAGAIDAPKRPEILPRWDDICVAVLYLAEQCNGVSFRLSDGRLPPRKQGHAIVSRIGDPPRPGVNIFASNGLGCAYAEESVLTVLSALGLCEGTAWTKRAELVFWRVQPKPWDMAVSRDPRFVAALEEACDTMPADMREEIARLTVITDEDIAARVVQSQESYSEMRARFGPKAKLRAPLDKEQARRSIASSRSAAIDWIFFRQWRISDGWLTPEQASEALEIFHDPLAMEMRRHVIRNMFPNAEIRNA